MARRHLELICEICGNKFEAGARREHPYCKDCAEELRRQGQGPIQLKKKISAYVASTLPQSPTDEFVARFKKDDEAYEKWVKNVSGFVYNNFGGSDINSKKIHRSDCPFLHMANKGKKTSVEKICSHDLVSLIQWLCKNGYELTTCKYCKPGELIKPIELGHDKQPVRNCPSPDNHNIQEVVDKLIAFGETADFKNGGGTWTNDKDIDLFLHGNPYAFLMAASIDREAKLKLYGKCPIYCLKN